MKRIIGLGTMIGALIMSSSALAAGIIVHSGQTVTLPCHVTGSVIVKSGGTVKSDGSCYDSTGGTVIDGALVADPGSKVQLCDTTVGGSLAAKQLAPYSFFRYGTVHGSDLHDATLDTSPGWCPCSVKTIN